MQPLAGRSGMLPGYHPVLPGHRPVLPGQPPTFPGYHTPQVRRFYALHGMAVGQVVARHYPYPYP